MFYLFFSISFFIRTIFSVNIKKMPIKIICKLECNCTQLIWQLNVKYYPLRDRSEIITLVDEWFSFASQIWVPPSIWPILGAPPPPQSFGQICPHPFHQKQIIKPPVMISEQSFSAPWPCPGYIDPHKHLQCTPNAPKHIILHVTLYSYRYHNGKFCWHNNIVS